MIIPNPGGYVMLDVEGLDVTAGSSVTKSGIYNEIRDAVATGKVIIVGGLKYGLTDITPVPASVKIIDSSYSLVVGDYIMTVGSNDSVTFSGLTGIGDLIVTCASMHSRNRRAGILIGKGYSMDEAMKEVQMVVEGVYSAKAALALSKKFDIPMPIVEQVNAVLFENKAAKDAVADLMLRDKKIEHSALSWDN